MHFNTASKGVIPFKTSVCEVWAPLSLLLDWRYLIWVNFIHYSNVGLFFCSGSFGRDWLQNSYESSLIWKRFMEQWSVAEVKDTLDNCEVRCHKRTKTEFNSKICIFKTFHKHLDTIWTLKYDKTWALCFYYPLMNWESLRSVEFATSVIICQCLIRINYYIE